MILRSLTKHVKDQNWFAVGLDFFIVVVGVFIGLQVQQWATERDTRQQEAVYIERLHDETVLLINQRKDNFEKRIVNRDALLSAHRKLFGDDKQFDFLPDECDALSKISIMTDLTTDLPTLTELLSAGQLNTIRSTELRASLIGMLQSTTRAKDALEGINRGVVILQQKYPELISIRLDMVRLSNDGYRFIAECKVQEMRKSVSFLNDFVEGHVRYGSYVEGAVTLGSEGLSDLHAVLDIKLSIIHEETTP